jgi:hypothetical protein
MRGHGHSCLESRRPQRSSLGLDSSHHGCLKQADVHLQTGPVQKWWKQRVGPAGCQGTMQLAGAGVHSRVHIKLALI